MAARSKTSKSKSSGRGHFVLMIGDEGAVLVQIQSGAVVRRLFAQSPDPVNVKGFEEALSNSPNVPITLLFDIMDQSYVRQTLPPVSSFSVGKIINRRLTKDFSPDDIKGFIILDREKTGRKDWNYMMVSLANTQILQKWIAFATERANPFNGMGLLPLEAQNFMKAIRKSLLKSTGKDASPLEWQILVSHHKVGGFRQIVMRGDKLVFTRMAQPFGDPTPGVMAGNIEQEIINTMEYLKRLGLQDQSQTSITIICGDEIKQVLDPRNIKSGEHHIFTPYEIASLLSLTEAAQVGDNFGDVVISSYIVKQRKLILPLYTNYTKKLRWMALAVKSVKLSGILGTLAALAWIGVSVVGIASAKQAIDSLETKHKTLNADLAKIKARAETLPKNVSLYSDIMIMTQLINKKELDVLSLVENLSASIETFALANSFHWSLIDPLAVTKATDKRQVQAEIELHMTTPPSQLSQEKLAEDVQEFTRRMKNHFSAYNITYSDLPGIISENKDIRAVLSDDTKANSANTQSDIIKVTMAGPNLDKNSTKAAGR